MSTADSIPASVYPRTAWGRPINDAYWFCFSCGFSFAVCFGALVYVALKKGIRMELNAFLQYATHAFSLVNILMAYANLLEPYGCVPLPYTAYAFSLAEIACDGYLLMIVWALVGPGPYQKHIRYAWIAFFVVAEILSRIVQYVFITYVPILIICRTTVNPTVSMISTALKTAFIVSMGVSMTYTLIRAKSDVVSAIGLKSVVACIFMIVAKIALFVPYGAFD
jgi:hypothetical protein